LGISDGLSGGFTEMVVQQAAISRKAESRDNKVEELSADIDPETVTILSGHKAQLTYPDFSARHIWNTAFRGSVKLNAKHSLIRLGSNVFLSISECDPIVTSQDPVPKPMLGDARFVVYNVVPYNGGVWAWVYVDWPDPLLTQTSYLVVNSQS
jgi:hypothetical protein